MTLGGPVGSGGSEVVLIEFIGDAKSAVAAGEETVGVLDQVTAAAERAGEAQAAAGKEASAAGKQSKAAAAESAAAEKKKVAATEESTAATDASTAATKRGEKATKDASAAALGSSAAWKKNSTALVGVGKGLTKYVSLPLVGIGAVATKMSLDFSKAMLLIETHTDTSRKMVDRYRKSILAMSGSGQYTQGPKELSEAMYHIASDGYKGSKALETLRESAHLATLGQSDLAETTYALVSAEKTGIKGTQSMHDAIGTLNGIVGAGDMKMQDLVGAMSTGILPAAKSVGLSLKDVGAALDVMTQRGVPAQQAAYRLSMNFQQLVPYTEKAQGAFEQLGLGQYQLAEAVKGPKGYLSALELLQQHLDGFNKYQQGTLIREIFGGGRTSRGMLTLLQNLGSMEQAYKSINHLSGETNKNLKTALASPANVWAKQWAQLQTVLVELGDQLVPVVIPALKEVAGTAEEIIGAFNSLPKGTQDWIIKIGLVAVALGPVLSIVGKIGKLVTTISETSLFAGAAKDAEAIAAGGVGAGAGGGAGRGMSIFEKLGLQGGAGAGAAALPEVAGAAAGLYGAYKLQQAQEHSAPGQVMERIETGGAGGSYLDKIKRSPVGKVVSGAASLYGDVTGGNTVKVGHISNVLKPVHDEFHKLVTEIELDVLQGGAHFGERINSTLHDALEKASKGWKVGTQPWRQHTAEAMQASVAAIRTGMKEGLISTGKGQKEINHLLEQIHLVKGKDPIGIASSLVESFKKAHGVTQAGVNQIDRDFAKMPKGAREAAINSTLEMADAWAKGHPKIERQVDVLRHNLAKKFGKTNQQLVTGVEGAAKGIAGLFGELGDSVSEALGGLGNNVNSVLKALGVKKDIHVVLETGHAAGNVIGAAVNSVKGAFEGGQATGGFTRVPGVGQRDTVPLTVNGALSAVVAPGEDLAVINRHQRPLLDHAVAATYGVNGLGDFFAKNNTPHYMAKGGLVEPKLGGPSGLTAIGQAGIHKAFVAAQAYLKKHRPKGGKGYTGPSYGPRGTSMFDGVLMATWVRQALEHAAAKGINPPPTSGYRSHAQNVSEGRDYYSEHEKTQYPGGAVDFGGMVDPPAYPKKMSVVHATSDFKYPLLAPVGFRDDGHASGTGHARGGMLAKLKKFAGGGVVRNVGSILLRNGLDAVSAAGILGNSYGESAWVPGAEDGEGDGGLWGFTTSPVSLPDLQRYAAAQHKSWEDEEIQTQFMLHHLTSGLKSKLNAASSTDETTSLFMHEWERPENYSSLGKRQSAAKKALGMLKGLPAGGKEESVAKQITGTYGPKEKTTGKGGGTNAPPRHYKVTTESLSFGSLPTTLPACKRELRERRKQLGEYKGAIADSKKDPKTKQALVVNEKAIRRRIAQLIKQRARLTAKLLKEKQVKKITARGLFPAIEKLIASKERRYTVTSQFAEQVAALEPEDEAAAADYRTKTETPAWTSVLDAEASWRNSILGGEEAAGQRLRSLEGQVEGIQALKKTEPKQYNKVKFKLPALKAAIAAVKQVFTPAQAKSFKALAAGDYVPAGGEFAAALESLQGPEGFQGDHKMMSSLPPAPVAGSFGGLIWDTQMALRELELGKGGGEPGEGNAALLAAIQQSGEHDRQGKALAELQYAPFAEFLKKMPPYIGAFGDGGDIPGPVGRAYTATVHGGETVIPAGAAGAPDVHLHLYGDMAKALEGKMPGIVREVGNALGTQYRHLVVSPGGGR